MEQLHGEKQWVEESIFNLNRFRSVVRNLGSVLTNSRQPVATELAKDFHTHLVAWERPKNFGRSSGNAPDNCSALACFPACKKCLAAAMVFIAIASASPTCTSVASLCETMLRIHQATNNLGMDQWDMVQLANGRHDGKPIAEQWTIRELFRANIPFWHLRFQRISEYLYQRLVSKRFENNLNAKWIRKLGR